MATLLGYPLDKNVPEVIHLRKVRVMSSKSPRINVSLDPSDLEIIQILSKKQHLSMSSIIKNMVHEWLEEYEDMKLIRRIEKREKEKNKLISHEEFWEDV